MQSVLRLSLVLAVIPAVVLAAAGGREARRADVPNASAPACPATAFDGFLAAFASRPTPQPAFTRYPLAYLSLDGSGSEPASRTL